MLEFNPLHFVRSQGSWRLTSWAVNLVQLEARGSRQSALQSKVDLFVADQVEPPGIHVDRSITIAHRLGSLDDFQGVWLQFLRGRIVGEGLRFQRGKIQENSIGLLWRTYGGLFGS